MWWMKLERTTLCPPPDGFAASLGGIQLCGQQHSLHLQLLDLLVGFLLALLLVRLHGPFPVVEFARRALQLTEKVAARLVVAGHP